MKSFKPSSFAGLVVSLGVGICTLFGCEQQDPKARPAASSPPAAIDVDVHPTEGQHHGELVEIGDNEYHIEIVHDDADGSVTAYVLDSTAKVAVPIDAPEITVNLSHDGQAEQFSLAASPQADDPAGRSSRFVSTDAELAEHLDDAAAAAQLVVSIDGKQFRGTMQHDHESHDGEAHE